jgi:hypothetical protein
LTDAFAPSHLICESLALLGPMATLVPCVILPEPGRISRLLDFRDVLVAMMF